MRTIDIHNIEMIRYEVVELHDKLWVMRIRIQQTDDRVRRINLFSNLDAKALKIIKYRANEQVIE